MKAKQIRTIPAKLVNTSKSPLYLQIMNLLAVSKAAAKLYDAMENCPRTPEGDKQFATLAALIDKVDFLHIEEIEKASAQVCEMGAPGVDIQCSHARVVLPNKAENPGKCIVIEGGIASDKKAIITLDKETAEGLVAELNKYLDILYPTRKYN